MITPKGEASGSKAMQTAAVATGAGTALDVTKPGSGGYDTLVAQVVGITTATITWQGTLDGTNWASVQATPLATGTAAATATADGLYRINVKGLKKIRANITAWTSGTITVTGQLVA